MDDASQLTRTPTDSLVPRPTLIPRRLFYDHNVGGSGPVRSTTTTSVGADQFAARRRPLEPVKHGLVGVIAIIALSSCSKTADVPSPCRQFAELQAKCTQFSASVKRLTEECEMFSEKDHPVADFDLTNYEDYKMVIRLRVQRRGAACAVQVKDCDALSACMEAAEAKEPPLPPAPPRPTTYPAETNAPSSP